MKKPTFSTPSYLAASSDIKVLEFDEDPSLKHNASDNPNHDMTKVPLREYRISSNPKNINSTDSSLFTKKTLQTNDNQSPVKNNKYFNFLRAIEKIVRDLFLPVGYPRSVRDGYIQYQIYDSLQGLCSYLRGVVSTSAVLQAAGVGDSEATAMSASMTWAMRDGLGMVGGLLFSYQWSCHFDSHVKEFRLFADVINDVGLLLDMLAPLFDRQYLLWIMSLATLCKVMCGMAAGATKGSITQHFAIRGNMADLNAKEGTQETLVSLVGMLLGITLAHNLQKLENNGQEEINNNHYYNSFALSWIIFVVLTIVHVWANYLGVALLRLRTLNRERTTIAMEKVIDAVVTATMESYDDDDYDDDVITKKSEVVSSPSWVVDSIESIPSPENVYESMWSSTRSLLFPSRRLRLGCSLIDIFSSNGHSDESLYENMQEFRHEKYFISCQDLSTPVIFVALRVGASDEDELKAFIHGVVLMRYLEAQKKGVNGESCNTDTRRSADVNEIMKLLSRTHRKIDVLFGHSGVTKTHDHNDSNVPRCLSLEELEAKGWDVQSRLYLGFRKWRLQWESSKLE